jgi:diguanylate cyclase (GGDEF)-like protein
MNFTRRAALSIDASLANRDAPSPAMQAVDRAWRHQYSDLREARDSAANAVLLAEASHDSRALAFALFQTAYAAIRLGSLVDATKASTECRAVFETLQDERGIWLARALQALCTRLEGEADKSIRMLQDLAAHPPIDATPTDLFVVHVALSLGYRFVGLLEPALKWHYQAVDTSRDTHDSLLLASTLCNLGGYHSDLHNPEEGCRLLEEGLELSSACSADRTTVIIALNLSQAYSALGRHDEALTIAEKYLTDQRYLLAMGGNEPLIPLTLALTYANAGRPEDAQRVFESVRSLLVRSKQDEGTPHVFWTYVEARIALVAGQPDRSAQIALATLNELNEHSVDSPSDLMQLHAIAAAACELIGDDRRALFHERCRAVIRERLARLAAHVASLTHTIRHELDTTRAERDRIMALNAELEREHERLAALNSALTAQIAENLRLHDELKEQNYRDALTGLHNRRYLYERGPRLLESNLQQGTPLCLVMLDLDHFKKLNDRHGHVVGDRVLVALGKLLRDGLRENDIVCRVGGEEFAMILPTSTATVAKERLQDLLVACRQMQGPEGEDALPNDLTFSAGIVEAPEHGTTIDALMIASDLLLYKAKNDGRARIEAAIESPQFTLPLPLSPAARETID